MASFPKRKESMLKVVDAVSKQCDKLCIWLNEYDEVPDELGKYGNLDVRLGGADNIKDAGKFAFLDKYYDCYYLTIDDDINYPPNYVQRITRNIDRYGRKCVISYHGHLNLNGRHRYFGFYDTLEKDHLCNSRLGTGVTGLVPSQIRLPVLTMEQLHEIDTDQSLSVWALNNGIPMICCAHRKGWMTNIQIGGVKFD